MKNKLLNVNEIFEIIKKGYISMFPYEFEGSTRMVIAVLDNYCKNILKMPLNVSLSQSYNEQRKPVLAEHIKISRIKEETSKLSSQKQDDIANMQSTLEYNIVDIVKDLEALHEWLVKEQLIRKKVSQYDPSQYSITKQLLELEKLPI